VEPGDDRRGEGGVKPEAAIDKAFKRIEEIFAKYKTA
jgi:hypothetical protein